MKKIFMIISAALLLAGAGLFTGCKNGEDGLDGSSAADLIVQETGNTWYKYMESSTNAGSTTPTGDNNGTQLDLGDIYIKYDTSSNKLVVAAIPTGTGVSSLVYAKTDKELTRGKWAASIVALRVAGKIKKYTTDPTSNRVPISGSINWGNFTIESLITTLFDD